MKIWTGGDWGTREQAIPGEWAALVLVMVIGAAAGFLVLWFTMLRHERTVLHRARRRTAAALRPSLALGGANGVDLADAVDAVDAVDVTDVAAVADVSDLVDDVETSSLAEVLGFGDDAEAQDEEGQDETAAEHETSTDEDDADDNDGDRAEAEAEAGGGSSGADDDDHDQGVDAETEAAAHADPGSELAEPAAELELELEPEPGLELEPEPELELEPERAPDPEPGPEPEPEPELAPEAEFERAPKLATDPDGDAREPEPAPMSVAGREAAHPGSEPLATLPAPAPACHRPVKGQQRKLTEEMLSRVEDEIAGREAWHYKDLAALVHREFGVIVHPSSIRRAVKGRPARGTGPVATAGPGRPAEAIDPASA